jgi:hypothetical protein
MTTAHSRQMTTAHSRHPTTAHSHHPTTAQPHNRTHPPAATLPLALRCRREHCVRPELRAQPACERVRARGDREQHDAGLERAGAGTEAAGAARGGRGRGVKQPRARKGGEQVRGRGQEAAAGVWWWWWDVHMC